MESVDRLIHTTITDEKIFNYNTFLEYYTNNSNSKYSSDIKYSTMDDFTKIDFISYPLFILNIPERLKELFASINFYIKVKKNIEQKNKYNIIIFTNYEYYILINLTILNCSHTIYYNWSIDIIFPLKEIKMTNFKINTNTEKINNSNKFNDEIENIVIKILIHISNNIDSDSDKYLLADLFIHYLYNTRLKSILDKNKSD